MFVRALIAVLEFFCDEDRRLQLAMGFLSVLAGLVLGIDIIQVATGTFDLNRHIPFIVPIALSAIVGMCWYILRFFPNLTPEQVSRVQAEARESSFLAPQHLPLERAEAGRIE